MNDKDKETIIPEVGMGATLIGFTDRHPYTIIEVNAKKTKIVVQRDRSIRNDANGFSESQTYTYEPDPNGHKHEVSLRKDGHWRVVGDTQLFGLGYRRRYHDYSF